MAATTNPTTVANLRAAYMIAFDNGAASRDEIAAEIGVTKSGATRLLEQLTGAGLLKSEGDDYVKSAEDTVSRADAEKLFDSAFGAGAAAAAEASDATAAFTWPKPAADVLADYLRERNAPVFDPDAELRPWVNGNGRIFIHSEDWRAWLAGHGMTPSRAQAAVPLREAGLTVRATAIPGRDYAKGFYQGAVMAPLADLPRRTPQRTRAPKSPFGRLTDAQRELVHDALAGMTMAKLKGREQLRDELLAHITP